MTTPLLISAGIVALYAALKAAKDILNDYWDASVFAKWSGGQLEGYFGHRDYVYARRYVGNDIMNPKRRVFTIPLLSHALEAVWDFWHLASTVQIALLIAGLVFVPVLTPWAALALWVWYFVTFEVFYRKVWI